jgi:SAM-dependent methyltransferase
MYRDVANETAPDLHFPTERPLAQGLGYPNDLLTRLPARRSTRSRGSATTSASRVCFKASECSTSAATPAWTCSRWRRKWGPLARSPVSTSHQSSSPKQRACAAVSTRASYARIEELPFDDGSVDAAIPNGVVKLSAAKRRVFAEAARVLRPGGRLALADFATEREIATPTARQAELWAACLAGASQIVQYLENLGAAGLRLRALQTNPAYRFASERAQRTSRKYAAHSVSLVALRPASGSRPTNPTTTEEISK